MELLADRILKISREHIEGGGLIVGQNLEGAQDLQHTTPVGENGVVILPTTEASGTLMTIGMALSGRSTMAILRFASFSLLHSSPLVFFAGRAKMLWGYECPLFVRISSDDKLGPTHTGMFHSVFLHQPGLHVVAPGTAQEYQTAWDWFQSTRQPLIVSEHRSMYANEVPLTDTVLPSSPLPQPHVLLIALGGARLAATLAASELRAYGIEAAVKHVCWIKPFPEECREAINVAASRIGRVIVTDSTFEPCSFGMQLAFEIMQQTHALVRVVGMPDRLPGVHEKPEPSIERIIQAVLDLRLEPLPHGLYGPRY